MSKAVFVYKNGKTYTARNVETLSLSKGHRAVSYNQRKKRDGITSTLNHTIMISEAQLAGYVWFKNNGEVVTKVTVNDRRVTNLTLLLVAVGAKHLILK